MEPIRVLQVVTKMDAAGIETLLMNFYRNIDRRKVQFDFLVHRDEVGFYDDEIKKLGGNIYRVLPIDPLHHRAYIKSLKSFFKKNNNYKIVHSHLNTYSMYVLREAKNYGIPVRIAHSHISNVPLDIKSPFRYYTRYKLQNYSNYEFACSYEAGQWMFKGAKNIAYINNSIDSEKYIYNRVTDKRLRAQYDLNDNLVVAHIGRFTKQKNHQKLIEIFKEISDVEPNAKLVLIGKGELEGKIKAEIKKMGIQNKILFLGEVSNVNEILQMVDVFIFPSFYEGLGIVAIESQAAGIKTFVSENIPREAFITTDIFEIDLSVSASMWAEKILRELPYKKKNNYKAIVDNNYDIVTEAKTLEEFYINIIKDKKLIQ